MIVPQGAKRSGPSATKTALLYPSQLAAPRRRVPILVLEVPMLPVAVMVKDHLL